MDILTSAAHREALREKITAGKGLYARIGAELRMEASLAMRHPLYSVTFSETRAASGDRHDYYSEAPYWWPNPDDPGGKFIRRDGEIYPGYCHRHRDDLIAMSHDFYLLSAAGALLDEPDFTARAAEIAKVWFLDAETKMNPHLTYAQAIFGVTKGRGIGIIDTTSLIGFTAGMEYFSGDARFVGIADGVKAWFADYLYWLDHSKNGIDERDYINNHANWWNAQAAAYAALTDDTAMLAGCADRLLHRILPRQTGEDGSFTDELTRTKSLTYSFFNLDATAITAEILYHRGIDVWHAEADGGRSLALSLDYMLPYYINPYTWRLPQIVGTGIGPHAAFQFGALRLDKKYAEGTKLRAEGRKTVELINCGALCLLEGYDGGVNEDNLQ